MVKHLLSSIARLLALVRGSTNDDDASVDMHWFIEVSAKVYAEFKEKSARENWRLQYVYYIVLKESTIYVDSERGSMLLGCKNRGKFRFAIDDIETGLRMEREAELGKFLVRLCPRADGLTHIYGQSSSANYHMIGMLHDVMSI